MRTGNTTIDNSQADLILGSDEVGYGCWAGSLVVCSVLLPRGWSSPGIGDSKTLTPAKRRTEYLRWTKTTPIPYHLVQVTAERIDELGLGTALHLAHKKALEALLPKDGRSCLIVVDGFPHGTSSIGVPNSIGLPKADALVPSVSLASIIAKVTRDDMMVKEAERYPGYGFAKHMGYGVPQHIEALKKLGPCPIHRFSYAPIREMGYSRSNVTDPTIR